MRSFSQFLFKNRSYTPIPFLLVMFYFQEATWWSLLIGFIVALSGELIRLWGVSYAGSETRTTGPVGGTYLVISGAFSYVRNPLYLGNMMMYVGIGIMSWALFPYLQIVAILFFYYQYYFIIREEEGYLKKTFGEQYERYYKNVPRLYPRLTSYKDGNVEQPQYDIKKGLKSETRTLQAFFFVTIILITLYVVNN